LTALFARLLNLTFGGGDPTMAALERELVGRRRWLTREDYGLAYGLARLTPGTNVLAFCAAAAWTVRGWRGALLAVAVGSAPSAVVTVLLTYGYEVFKSRPLATGVIAGLLASAVGMMAAAAWSLVRPQLRRGQWLRTLVLTGGSVVLLLFLPVSPIIVLALAAAAGFFWKAPEAE
jgi:chromate transporter